MMHASESEGIPTCELALASDLDAQHAVAAAAALIHLGLCAVPGLCPHFQTLPCLLYTAHLYDNRF